jgi:hypothetical protein
VFQQANRAGVLATAIPQRFYRAREYFHRFHFQGAGVRRLGHQAASVFQLTAKAGGLAAVPSYQDSTRHLGDALPGELRGLFHDKRIEDGRPGLKET